MPETAEFVCPTCGQQTPRYFAVEGKRGPVCLGCGFDRWIPAGYEDRERYRPACPYCGGVLFVIEGPGREGERQFQCDRCTLRWEELELTHLNATRRPALGVAWLDERHPTTGEMLLRAPQPLLEDGCHHS